ncbi:hypothetical protein [Bradyrhizobium sp. IC4059]|uniref:hypothetical protein n=1 Tax=Bradyrhizobium sp. IC4059 TaxID=2793805 RepID=UPI001CD4D9E5|nr:hypothetical protein [Bradyrhizobium sp. IC4059]MCA1358729.1 hypothetical protein [Bradyrhizobium sp. IC4059]
MTKALTDGGRAGSFEEAEARLNAVRIDVVVGGDQVSTTAGQAAALIAVATARKCFGRVTLVIARDVPLIAALPLGGTMKAAARRLGARVDTRPSRLATHTIGIGDAPAGASWNIRCWWDRWLAGTRAFDGDEIGDSRLPLSGVFAGAVAVRQVFACVLAGHDIRARDTTVSLWTPWLPASMDEIGPDRFDVPDKLWLLGLGHLGQAFVWTLCFLPGQDERLVVLQDNQKISEENEATSLLVLPGDGELGEKKVRVAGVWLKQAGWETSLIERRHVGDLALGEDDPPILLSGLDRLKPRLVLAKHGFPFMIDAGIGHGPGDFEGVQVRTIVNGEPPESLWSESAKAEDTADGTKGLLNRPAYMVLEQHVGECGKVSFAQASVAVPFVGAATGAIVIGQAIRLATLEPAPVFLQMELGAPEMATLGGLTEAPNANLGSFSVRL